MRPLSEPVQKYIDETGLLLENAGMPRIAGLVLGWLQVCEPEVQSLHDIIAALGISKASASNMTRFLEHVGIVERTVLPGERRDHFRISNDAWHRFMQTRVETMARLRRNADHGLRVLQNEPPQRRDRLERMRRLYAFLEKEMPKLLRRFETDEAANNGRYVAEVEIGGRAV
jgi:DNA-binding transcriptional regulator GbsR (MarR family)